MKDYLRLNNEMLQEFTKTGKLNLAKDKQATRKYFLEEVNVKLRYFIDVEEKVKYLIEENYYEKEYLEKYSMKFIKEMYKLAYSYNFRFPSFMSAHKFYNNYAMKSRDEKEILEKYEDRIVIIALYLAQGNEELARKAVKSMMTAYQPATPTALNSGKSARGELVSCFKIRMDDSMNSISKNIGYALELSRLGGGVGIDLTDLRPLGDPIKGILNRASGVMPVAKLLENSFSYANQLGQRNGSGVVYLNIFHADIENYISAKKPNSDEKIRLATLSTGLIIPNIFFELVRKNKDIVLFSPYDIQKEYGKRMSEIDMSEMYYQLLDNPRIRKIKRINAAKLYTEVKKSQFESGYPFEIFDNNVNDYHALKGLGRVKMSNLCTEILQYQTTSVINDEGIPDEHGFDVSCNLGSVDVHEATKVDNFEELIDTSMLLLTQVSDLTTIKNVISIAKANELMHSVGLGIMNVHAHLAVNGIEYGSKDGVQFIDLFTEALNFYSLKSSMLIAKRTKQKFYGFEKSDYATGEYFTKYKNKKDIEISNVVSKALGNVPVITKEMWADLQKDVEKYGVYNAYRLAIAPTGSISYVRSCTASMAPITEQVEIRDYADSRTIYPAAHMTDENRHLFKEAYEVDQYKMIDMYAAAQKHIDQGISMTLYVTDDWTTEQLARVYIYAWKKGIKTVYYVRQRLKTIDECVQCSI